MKVALGFIFITMLLIICAAMVQANTIGVSYNKVAEDTGWGAIANLEGDITEGVVGELDIQLQGGDIIKGRYTAEVGISGISVFHSGNIKGYSLEGLGNELDLGAKGTINVSGLDVSVGVFGRNASEFAGRTAQSILVDENDIDEDVLPDGLEAISPDPTGLKIVPGSSVNLLLETEFDVEQFAVGVRAMPQLTGEVKAHQLLVIANTDVPITEDISLNLGGEVAFQSVEDVIEYETAALITVDIEF